MGVGRDAEYKQVLDGNLSPHASNNSPMTHNQLGLINGVVVPCSLNILGVVLFLWLPWALGQAGGGELLGMFVLGETQTVLTVLSLSAIVSNGTMKGGGSYFMISRSLGPELGGAMGFLFYISYAVSATFYAAGFGKEVQQTWFPDMTGAWNGMFLTLCSSIALLLVLVVALIGASLFTKINSFLFLIQFVAIFTALGSIFFGKPQNSDGWSSSKLRENWGRGYASHDDACDGGCDFRKVFAIVFPAVTGVMEGANLSGDLKNPGRDIGRGTLIAVLMAFMTYILLIIAFAGAFDRDELRTNQAIFQEACVNNYIVVVGILVSTSSSALGAIFGGSRVLQALARDELFPYTKFLGKGTAKGDEPWVAVLFTWGIAQACAFIGGLDKIAPIISTFFCLSYACCNLACFLVSISGTPNFRPRFKYFSWHTCVAGILLNIFIMFYLNVYYAAAAICLMLAIFAYLVYKAPTTTWGDVRQALMYHQVRKYLLRLDARKQHGKTWRPSVLLLINKLNGPLVEFCNHMKKGGLYVIGNVVLGNSFDRLTVTANRMQKALGEYIHVENLKAFPAVAVGRSARTAYQNLMLTSGLGAMTPNTVVIPFIEGLSTSKHEWDDSEHEKMRMGIGLGLKTRVVPEEEENEIKQQEAKIRRVHGSSPMSQSQIFHNLSVKIEKKDYTEGRFFQQSVKTTHSFVNLMVDARALSKNVIVVRHFDKLSTSHGAPIDESEEDLRVIDMWLLDQSSVATWESFKLQVLLMAELGHILLRNKAWGRKSVMRVVLPVRVARVKESYIDLGLSESKEGIDSEKSQEQTEPLECAQARKLLLERLAEARFNIQRIKIIAIPDIGEVNNEIGLRTSLPMDGKSLNRLVKEHSSSCLLALLPLPRLHGYVSSHQDATEYYQLLGEISDGLPPCAFFSESDHTIMSREI
ncbi:hypothetical protein AAMO2058_000202100 [Amorphochlora amoebiformis]